MLDIYEPMNFAELFYFLFSWLRFHVILRVLLILRDFTNVVASLSHYSMRFAYFFDFISAASWLIRSYYALFSATSYLSTHPILAEVVDVISISLPVSSLREKREREKSAHSSTSPSAETETTKCLPRKCTWKGLNALSRYRLPCRSPFLSPSSFPSHPMRSRFHCFLSLRPSS